MPDLVALVNSLVARIDKLENPEGDGGGDGDGGDEGNPEDKKEEIEKEVQEVIENMLGLCKVYNVELPADLMEAIKNKKDKKEAAFDKISNAKPEKRNAISGMSISPKAEDIKTSEQKFEDEMKKRFKDMRI